MALVVVIANILFVSIDAWQLVSFYVVLTENLKLYISAKENEEPTYGVHKFKSMKDIPKAKKILGKEFKKRDNFPTTFLFVFK